MNRIDKLHKEEIWESLFLRIPFLVKKNQWTRQSVGAVLGLGGGIVSFVLTMTLAVFNWLTRDGSVPLLKEIDFVSLISVLPLLALGAHCLDLLEKESWKVKNARLSFSDSGNCLDAQHTETQ